MKKDYLSVKDASRTLAVKNAKKTSQKNTHTLFSKNMGHFYQKCQYLVLAFSCFMAEVRTSLGIGLTFLSPFSINPPLRISVPPPLP